MSERHAWWKEAVVYQVYPRSFSDSNGDGIGDLNGITKRLPYLKNLGIDVIWLSPVYRSPNADNGYDISDYREIMSEFGTMDDFDRMLKAAHEAGIKVVMDLVVNHTSDEHKWFEESRKSKDNPYRDYYIWKKEPNNWGSFFSGSAWQYDERTEEYYLHLFGEKQPDLNWADSRVRNEIYDMMTWWCEKGIDGFRMDVINFIGKEGFEDGIVEKGSLYGDHMPFTSSTNSTHLYLREMNERVLKKYNLLTVGETVGVRPEQAIRYADDAGNELCMVFQFEHVNLHGDGENGKWNDEHVSMPELREVLNRWQQALDGAAWNSLYFENHDQPRSVDRFGDSRPIYRETSAKMLATLLFMMKGTPYIYQGEELGMTNPCYRTIEEYRDIEALNAWKVNVEEGNVPPEDMLRYLAFIARDNARSPMQWDASENAGFTDGKPWIGINPDYIRINAEQQMNDPNSVFHYYRKLIQLRHELPIIVYGSFHPLLTENSAVYAYDRRMGAETIRVLCNFSDRNQACELAAAKPEEMLISNYDVKTLGMLRPYEAQVFVLN